MKTKLREMVAADVPVLLEKLREQNQRDGTSYAMPQVFDRAGNRLPRIPLALTAVDLETGEPVQGHVWETTLEHMTFGTDAAATVASMHEQDAVFWMLREKGYRDEHIFVPLAQAPLMEHGLDRILGMQDTGRVLKHFYRLLDPADNDELRQWYKRQEESDEPSPAGTGAEHSAG